MGNIFPSKTPWEKQEAVGTDLHGEWDITDVKHQELILGLPLDHVYTRYTMTLERRSSYYAVMMVLPIVLTSYLNVLVFLLPPDYGDKASYLITISISLSVFSSFFNSDMPRGLTSTPRIFKLYVFVLIGGFVQLLLTLLVVRKYKREQTKESSCKPSKPESTNDRIIIDSPPKNSDISDDGDYQNKSIYSKGFFDIVHGISATQLDLIFFITSFVGNTIGIIILLVQLSC